MKRSLLSPCTVEVHGQGELLFLSEFMTFRLDDKGFSIMADRLADILNVLKGVKTHDTDPDAIWDLWSELVLEKFHE